MALVPQHDPRLAAAELERAVTTHGFVGGVMRPNRIGGRTADHPDFDVLWDKAQQLDVPMSLHEAYLAGIDTIGLDRMSSYAGCHIVSHVFEQMAAMVNVTLAGIFSALPEPARRVPRGRLRVGAQLGGPHRGALRARTR